MHHRMQSVLTALLLGLTASAVASTHPAGEVHAPIPPEGVQNSRAEGQPPSPDEAEPDLEPVASFHCPPDHEAAIAVYSGDESAFGGAGEVQGLQGGTWCFLPKVGFMAERFEGLTVAPGDTLPLHLDGSPQAARRVVLQVTLRSREGRLQSDYFMLLRARDGRCWVSPFSVHATGAVSLDHFEIDGRRVQLEPSPGCGAGCVIL